MNLLMAYFLIGSILFVAGFLAYAQIDMWMDEAEYKRMACFRALEAARARRTEPTDW